MNGFFNAKASQSNLRPHFDSLASTPEAICSYTTNSEVQVGCVITCISDMFMFMLVVKLIIWSEVRQPAGDNSQTLAHLHTTLL